VLETMSDITVQRSITNDPALVNMPLTAMASPTGTWTSTHIMDPLSANPIVSLIAPSTATHPPLWSPNLYWPASSSTSWQHNMALNQVHGTHVH
jgi:hypothetical protein